MTTSLMHQQNLRWNGEARKLKICCRKKLSFVREGKLHVPTRLRDFCASKSVRSSCLCTPTHLVVCQLRDQARYLCVFQSDPNLAFCTHRDKKPFFCRTEVLGPVRWFQCCITATALQTSDIYFAIISSYLTLSLEYTEFFSLSTSVTYYRGAA